MKLLFDFFPILLFFVAYKLAEDPAEPHRGILVATAVAIVASAVQVAISWWRQRRVERMHLVTLALIVVLGGATLVLRDEIFIKWKPTAVNWLFAVVFLVSQFVGRAPLVRRMMESAVQLPDPVWARLNLSWVAFFLVLGLANLYVVYHFDTETWVNFKLFGLLGLTLAFVLGQGLYLARYMEEGAEKAEKK
jgi:intracellular septation protein